MKKQRPLLRTLAVFLTLLLGAPQGLMAQSTDVSPQEAKTPDTEAEKPFKQEELDQLLAPIALYPDSLLTQVLMASTYPLEIVQADRWVKKNKDVQGDALTKALEAEPWDPSVKSLVQFPDVLAMMSEDLETTQKLGDAFLAQQKEVMDTIQMLRKKAEEEGNLKTTKEQTVIVEKETIIIEPADPKIIYVPTYNPTVVYGTWWYPAYPPYPYYPPYYPRPTLYGFGAGVVVGAAWGYAWGHANWRGGDINININRNTNINHNINRDRYRQQGNGKWQHDASHRGGVAYKDRGTAQKYNRGTGSQAAKSREAFRGKADTGRQNLARGGADQMRGGPAGSRQQPAARPSPGSMDRSGTRQKMNTSAFTNTGGGAQAKRASSRGNQSMSSSRARGGGMSRPSGGGARGGGRGR